MVPMRPPVRGIDVQLDIATQQTSVRVGEDRLLEVRSWAAIGPAAEDNGEWTACQIDERAPIELLARPQLRLDPLRLRWRSFCRARLARRCRLLGLPALRSLWSRPRLA